VTDRSRESGIERASPVTNVRSHSSMIHFTFTMTNRTVNFTTMKPSTFGSFSLPYIEADLVVVNSGSLCASQQCGRPIEGPCLLTADNKRYHPGHLACDYGSGHRPCGDPMMDYFEIGTLKVCERHKDAVLSDTIKRSRNPGGDSGPTFIAEKRRTRVIDSSKLKQQWT
jgi:hypothetical protein